MSENGRDASRPANTLTPPSPSLPKGGGAIRGIGEKFAANPVSGSSSLSIPLAVSPGRAGFGPQLSLSYDSAAGNGPFGFGWRLSLPTITRKTDKGLPQYRDAEESDVYILSGAEDLVPVLKSDGSRFADATTEPEYIIHRYRPRIETLYARIERWTKRTNGDVHWRSITRDNVTTIYGRDQASRVVDPADPARIFSWMICQYYDDKGHAVVYEYSAENDANVDRSQQNERHRERSAPRYVKRIKYGNVTSRLIDPGLEHTGWLFEVVFDYDEGHVEPIPSDDDEQHRQARAAIDAGGAWAVRPDPFSSYRSGFEIRTYRRCRRVLMFHRFAELGEHPCLVRSTDLEYADLDYSQPIPVDAELVHEGSTRLASFIRSATHSGYVRNAAQPVVDRQGVAFVTYLQKSFPPVEFDYSKPAIQDDIRTLDTASGANLPAGLDADTQWVDLDGEGLSGVLVQQADAWFYKPNLGGGQLGALETIVAKPSSARAGSKVQLLDLAGDGQLDVVAFDRGTPGFFERTADLGWQPFRAFRELPNIPWQDPNLRFVDLDGDGQPDVLITEHEVFTWYPSLGEDGFGPSRQVRQSSDDERGPRLVLGDGTQSIYLADMCGDGLTDLVRIRNGETCYWPNLGYGHFGFKVTMDDAPWFDSPDSFDQRRIRLADIDGSGTNDIIYLASDGPRLYFNQSGNRWSAPRRLARFPRVDNLASVATADLLGNGTACLIWSSPSPGDTGQPLRYIDLMGGQKPHLLVKAVNNLGAENVIEYAPSTKFYLADKRAGKPWVTRLPFPVHVVERVVKVDRINRNRFVTRYAYHHGYFDGIEREFRGFGLVEQWDTEEFAAFTTADDLPPANSDRASHVPAVYVKSWFHTGIYAGRDHVSDFFAGLLDEDDAGEYYREPGRTDVQARGGLLDDTVLPDGLTVEEEREACRALKGSMLRQEVYARDGTDKQRHPYIVTEQNFTVRVQQRRGDLRHGVFCVHPREAVTSQYERNPGDPRVSHEITLEVDTYGNVLKLAAISYGRRQPDPSLPASDQEKQARQLILYTENLVTNTVDDADDYRASLPYQSRTYELTGIVLPAGRQRFAIDDIARAAATSAAIAYHETPTPGVAQKRLIEHLRMLYRRNDLAGPLEAGIVEGLALPFESYKLAFTPALIADVYGTRVADAMLERNGGGCGYVHGPNDADWWIPTGQMFYSPRTADTPAEERAYARGHFYFAIRYRDPFYDAALNPSETIVAFDGYDLLIEEKRDARGNRVTVGERALDPALPLVRTGQDYRVLQPALVMDPNRNRMAVVFDALGLVAGTAVMGKPEASPVPGDRLDPAFEPDLTERQVKDFFANPDASAAALLLRNASSRVIYDLDAYRREGTPGETAPAMTATLARETHASEPVPSGGVKVQVSFAYSDGFGREIQKKMPAPPTAVGPRWIGSGWTVFNNKGKAVRQYEPFFTDTHRFQFDVRSGVSPVMFYDPLDRVVVTVHPNHTWGKVVFDSWKRVTYDVNDTVAPHDDQTGDPRTDRDVGAYVREYFKLQPPSWQTWLEPRSNGNLGAAEQEAAAKARLHADTPASVYFDTLGRPFLSYQHNGFRPDGTSIQFATRFDVDIEGNQREVRDALDRVVMRYDYDMLGRRIHEASMDKGQRWVLPDVAGTPLRAWNSRGHAFRTEYDVLRRVEKSLVQGADTLDPGREVLVSRTVYGDDPANGLTGSAAQAANLLTRVYQQFDAAGLATNAEFDFKGNLLRSSRRFGVDYRATPDWSANPQPALETDVFTSGASYDAINRPVTVQSADGSVGRHTFNETGLLARVDMCSRGESANGQPIFRSAVSEITYNARGQRERLSYANGCATTYAYDVETSRLTSLETRRPAGPNGIASAIFADAARVQGLRYTVDPIGNITRIEDGALAIVFHDNQRVEPISTFTYDALYRLTQSSGREHIDQTAIDASPPSMGRRDVPYLGARANPSDLQALRNYSQSYGYDGVGNFLSVLHAATAGNWTRDYTYAEPSLNDPSQVNNRLTRTVTGADVEGYTYVDGNGHDAQGCTTAINAMQMEWDYLDHLRTVDLGGGGRAWYVYDEKGQRARKVIDRQNATRKEERLYLGGCEIFREYGADGVTVMLARETAHVMDDQRRIALVETLTVENGSTVAGPVPRIRYQLGNHLGSSSLELDADGGLISYEEYHAFGTTAFQASSATEVTAKRYRWSGLERDEETGLGYHRARYYAPWLGRWTSPEPDALSDGPNLYVYVRNQPVNATDPSGHGPLDDLLGNGGYEVLYENSVSVKNTTFYHVIDWYNSYPEPSAGLQMSSIQDEGFRVSTGARAKYGDGVYAFENELEAASMAQTRQRPYAAFQVGSDVNATKIVLRDKATGSTRSYIRLNPEAGKTFVKTTRLSYSNVSPNQETWYRGARDEAGKLMAPLTRAAPQAEAAVENAAEGAAESALENEAENVVATAAKKGGVPNGGGSVTGTAVKTVFKAVNVYFAYKGVKTSLERRDAVGTVINASTVVPGVQEVTAPLALWWEGTYETASYFNWTKECAIFAFRDVYDGTVDRDDKRRWECWDFYPNGDKPDWDGVYQWEWERK